MAFEWKYRDHDYAPSWHCKAYPFFASVMDCDGDSYSWGVSKHKEVVASGYLGVEESIAHNEDDDFALGKEKCEEVLREKIAEYLARIDADIARLRVAIAA